MQKFWVYEHITYLVDAESEEAAMGVIENAADRDKYVWSVDEREAESAVFPDFAKNAIEALTS